MAHVAVVEVQAAGTEDPRGEVQLPLPVLDDRPAEELPRPGVHLAGDLFGDLQEERGAGDRELQVPLVVERHRRHLAERVLAVEHPAVRARQQCVGDVADALLHRDARLRRRPRALNPLPLQVGRDLAASEPAGTGIRDREVGAREPAVGRKELDALFALLPAAPPLEPQPHQLDAPRVERSQRQQRRDRLRREHVAVGAVDTRANLQSSPLRHESSPTG